MADPDRRALLDPWSIVAGMRKRCAWQHGRIDSSAAWWRPEVCWTEKSFHHVYMTMKRVVLLSMFLLGPSPS